MKRIVSLVLALSMVLSMFSMSFAGTGLKDVKGTEYEAAVEALIELGIVTGYPDGTFLPNNVVTRAELSKLLVVAYGLEPAAEASKGTTPFEDINAVANHWASGYINVSADYKFVNGYPDGSFKGDATVTYAEAITMCLRVLGYANEVDSKGTWPTNYIAKAQDLKLMEGIDYQNYNNGAKRGDIALLIWNMLRTPMWQVVGESEGDGLQSRPNNEMINVKFPDYAYDDEARFAGFTIEEDTKNECAKVMMEVDFLTYDEKTGEYSYVGDSFEYLGNDFYTFVPGTEVEVLINEEEDLLLTIVPTDEDKLVKGAKDVIDEDYATLRSGEYDYAYARVVKKDVVDASILTSTSKFIDEITKKDKYATIDYGASSDWKCMFDTLDYEVFLKDGERILFSKAVKDGEIAAGDIITEVTVSDYAAGTSEKFYIVGGSEIEGEFEIYELVEFENSDLKFEQLTIDGKGYPVDAAAMFVEDPEKDNYKVLSLADNSDQKMKGEEVVVKLDALFGKVVRVDFDGKIDSGNDSQTSVQFYAIGDNDVDRNSDKRYFYDFVNEDGPAAEILIDKNTDLEATAKSEYVAGDELTGSYVVVTLNEDDEIEAMQYLVKDGEFNSSLEDVLFGDSGEDEYYKFLTVDSDNYETSDEDNMNWFMDGQTQQIKATDSTVLVKVVVDEEDDEITVEFETGLEAIKKEMKTSQDVLAVYDASSVRMRAKYLVVITDGSDNSDFEVGVVDSIKAGDDVYVGDTVIKLADSADKDTKEIIDTLLLRDSESNDYNNHALVVYTVTTKEVDGKEERTFNFKSGLRVDELNMENTHGVVVDYDSEDDSFFVEGDSKEYTLGSVRETYEDKMIVLVNVTETETEGQYEVESYKVVDAAEADIMENDRISIRTEADVLFIIRGMAELPEQV